MRARPTILVVGDEAGATKPLRKLGFRTVVAGSPETALQKARESDLVLVNLPDPAAEVAFLRELYKEGRPTVILAHPDLPTPPIAPRNGRIHVLTRPVRDEDLSAALRGALADADSAPGVGEVTVPPPRKQFPLHSAPLWNHSPAMRAIREIVERVADTNATVLIRGESGVGKELVARAIHCASEQSDRPFVKVNCAALPTELLESELFGHEKGAFTGAYRRKLGKFEYANQGTLFLDEIGELALPLQAKLLHVLQDHEFSRVGGREAIRVVTRVIACTNRNLEAALAAGQFREDLYYRLNVVEIHVPPLRERKEEIPGLVTYFLEKFQRQYQREVHVPTDIIRCFTEYPWPGNVRELENLVRRVVVLGNVRQIHEDILTRLQVNHVQQSQAMGMDESPDLPSGPQVSMGLRAIARRAAREAERRAIAEVLDRVHWNRTKAARLLKISYKTLLAKIADCGLALVILCLQ